MELIETKKKTEFAGLIKTALQGKKKFDIKYQCDYSPTGERVWSALIISI